MKFAITILLIVAFCSGASAQELSIMRAPDTVSLRSLVFPTSENSLWQAPLLAPLNTADSASLANLPPGFLRSEMLASPSFFQDQYDPTSSLKLLWQQEDRFKFLRSALGYIQAGGTAYLLYRAQKKYHYIR
jgi:hypothetical protein